VKSIGPTAAHSVLVVKYKREAGLVVKYGCVFEYKSSGRIRRVRCRGVVAPEARTGLGVAH
jgi:hypothetical protein